MTTTKWRLSASMDVVDVCSIAAVEVGEDGDGGESCLISASLGLVSCSMTVEDLFCWFFS